jgi:hypothetical protein
MKDGEPEDECYLWRYIRPYMAIQWTTGGVENGGFAIYPRPTRYPLGANSGGIPAPPDE